MRFVRTCIRLFGLLAALVVTWYWSVGIDSGVNAIGLSPAVVMQGQTVPPPARHWEEIALDGGNVTAIAFHPSDHQIVFAATTTGGVFRSTDAGQTWAERNSGLNKPSVIGLVINAQNGNELYAATREQVFKSTNGGASWTTILQDVDVRALAIDPDNGASIYVATGDRLSEFGALYHSANGGQTWATLYQLRGAILDVAVTKASDKVFIAFVPANAPFQGLPWVYATDATTINWQRACPIEDPERIYSCEVADLYVNPQESDGVYAIYGQDIFKAANGIEWQSLGRLPLAVTPTRISSTSSGDIVYVGSETGIFRTSDGATWTSVDSSIGNLEIQTLATSPLRDGLLLAGTHGQGVLRSTTSGDSWANTSTGMRTPYINHLIIGGGGQTLYASGYRSGIFRSRDGGQTWSIRNTGLDYLGVTALAMHPVDQDILYLGTEVDYTQVLAYGIYKTTNGGDAWVRTSTGLPSDSHVLSIAVDPQAPTTLLAAFEDDRLYRSIDAGESWSQISAITLSHLIFHPTTTNLVYGFTSYWDGIHRSTDGGVTWTQLGEHLTTVTGLSLAPDGGNGLWVGTDGGKLYHSDDGGATWVEHAIGVSAAVWAIAVNPANRQHLLVALGSEGVYESLDGGSVWTALNAGLRWGSAYGVLFDATDTSRVYAFGIGIHRLTTSENALYLPLVVYSPRENLLPDALEGQVTEQEVPVMGLELMLLYGDGAGESVHATAITDAAGNYRFDNLPALGADQWYRVAWNNSGDNPNRLSRWRCRAITVAVTDPAAFRCTFDLADVELLLPEHEATVALPQTFTWRPRTFTTDSYELNLAHITEAEPHWWTNPPLGHVDHYTLNSLPNGFMPGQQYAWWLWVYGPNGYGISGFSSYVTFANAGIQAESEGERMAGQAGEARPAGSR